MKNNLKFAIRALRKRPIFALVCILTLGLGIGANSAMFSVLYSVVLNPLPYAEPDRLMAVFPAKWFSQEEFAFLREHLDSYSHLAVYGGEGFTLTGGEQPILLEATQGSAEFFPTLGINPLVGEPFFQPEVERPGNNRQIVLEHGFWLRQFGGDRDIVGRSIMLDGNAHTILGVMPPSFRSWDNEAALWVPMTIDPSTENYESRYLKIIGRLKPGVSRAQAERELKQFLPTMAEHFAYIEDLDENATVVSLQSQIVGDVKPKLRILLGAVVLILLIACANVANLVMVRAVERQREIALRISLGARIRKLLGQMLTENILLSLLGGAFGLLLANWGVRILVAFLPPDTPRLSEIRLDVNVLLFTLVLAVLTGLFFSLLPALRLRKPQLQSILKEGGRSEGSGGGSRLRTLFVVAQISLALVLLISAGLMIRSLSQLYSVDVGFNLKKVLTLRLDTSVARYPTPEERQLLYTQILDRIEALPGVERAGAIQFLPLMGNAFRGYLRIETQPLPPQVEPPLVSWRVATPGYFEALGIPLREGRTFESIDDGRTAPVTIIDANIASTYWPDESPIGKRISSGLEGEDAGWATIIGVVEATRAINPSLPAVPVMYRPYSQVGRNYNMNVVVKTATDPMQLVQPIREEVWSIDSSIPVFRIRSMEQIFSDSISESQVIMSMLMLFAFAALALGAIGVYGLMSYSVTNQTHEIGLRMALGAENKDILNLFLGRGLKIALVGVAIGLAGAFATVRLISSLLFEVSTTDILTYLGASLILLTIAILGCFIPARRATQVAPTVALRTD